MSYNWNGPEYEYPTSDHWAFFALKNTWHKVLRLEQAAMMTSIDVALRHESEKKFDELLTHDLHDKGIHQYKKFVLPPNADRQHYRLQDFAYPAMGMDATSALAFLYHDVKTTGGAMPPLVVQDESEDHLRLWTEEDAEAYLRAVTHARCRVENACNVVRLYYRKHFDLINSDHVGLASTATDEEKDAERARIHWKLVDDIQFEDVTARFDAALIQIDEMKDELPTDPDKARKVVNGLISAVANDRMKEILAVVSEADKHLPPSCVEQETATKKVSSIRQFAFIQIAGTDDVEQMKTIYDGVKGKLAAIQVLNSPVWTDTDGNDLTLNADGEYEVTFTHDPSATGEQTVLDLRYANPTNLSGGRLASELGNPAFIAVRSRVGGRVWRFTTSQTVTLTGRTYGFGIRYVGNTPPPADALVSAVARNNCGPSELKIRITSTTR